MPNSCKISFTLLESGEERSIATSNGLRTVPNESPGKLKYLGPKGAKNSKWLGRAGRAVPFVGAIASAYDAHDRFQKGDTFGGVLSVASMMPGPVGWWALGAQVAYDIEGAVNKDGFKSSVNFFLEQDFFF